MVSQTARIRRHYELFQLLQVEVQYFIPHQILICAWGDFSGPDLMFDVISGIPGVRTGWLGGCNIGSLLKRLHSNWLACDRQPMLFDGAATELRTYPACGCALHRSLQGMRSVLVHGIHDGRDGTDSLYVAANTGPIVNDRDIERFRFLADAVIAQIDVAFRRVTGLKSWEATVEQKPRVLSAREEEILACVSEGRTNFEISRILGISGFTVKNHVQRIIKKLGATNRTEAAAKYRHLGPEARGQTGPSVRKGTRENEVALAAD